VPLGTGDGNFQRVKNESLEAVVSFDPNPELLCYWVTISLGLLVWTDNGHS